MLAYARPAPQADNSSTAMYCWLFFFAVLFNPHNISCCLCSSANAQHRARDTSGPRRYVPIRFIFISRAVGLVGGIVDRTTNTVPFPPARLYLLSPSVYCCCCLPLYAPLYTRTEVDGWCSSVIPVRHYASDALCIHFTHTHTDLRHSNLSTTTDDSQHRKYDEGQPPIEIHSP